MRILRTFLPILLCSVVLLGCNILSVERKVQVSSPQTAPTTVPATFCFTIPETQPAETTIPPTEPTEVLHSPLYLPELPVEDVITFFNEVCLSAEYVNSGDPSLVQKWTGPLVYQVHGHPTPEDMVTLEGFAAALNQIPGFPGIREAQYPEEATLNINFCSRNDFVNLMGDNFLGADGGVTFWYEQNQIYNAIIGICTDLDQELRNSVIQEELYNGLGPVQDTVLRTDSIIWSGFSHPQSPTPVDWLILELLYHPDIQCGWNAEACEKAIRSLYY